MLSEILIAKEKYIQYEENNKIEEVLYPAGKGYINIKGEWIIKPIFDKVSLFEDSLAIVQKNGKK